MAYELADAALYAAKLAGKALEFTPHDIADNICGGILVYQVGGNGKILFANKNMAELFGCPDLDEFMDIVKGCLRYVVHPDEATAIHTSIMAQVAPDDVGGELRVSYRIIARDESIHEILPCSRVVNLEGVGTAVYAIPIDTSADR